MPTPVSAIDVIGPAIDRAKNLMFKPIRWSRWWRAGLLALATGELASGGSCNIHLPSNMGDWGNLGGHPRNQFAASHDFLEMFHRLGLGTAQLALLITVLVVGILLLVVLQMYIGSVLRFVLFDGVTTGRFHIIEGWKRWRGHGWRYFLFQISLALIVLAGYVIIVGIPAGLAAMAGVFKNSSEHVGLIVLGVLAILPILLVFVLGIALVHLFAKDFAVPIMALENASVPDALRRVWAMIKAAKGENAGYVGMKFLLALTATIAFGILQFFVMFILLVPVVVIAVAKNASLPGLISNPFMLALVITVGIVIVFVMIFFFAIIGAPITVFFISYGLEFFGSRYEPLWALLHPAPPVSMQPPAMPEPPAPPLDNPPEPSPA